MRAVVVRVLRRARIASFLPNCRQPCRNGGVVVRLTSYSRPRHQGLERKDARVSIRHHSSAGPGVHEKPAAPRPHSPPCRAPAEPPEPASCRLRGLSNATNGATSRAWVANSGGSGPAARTSPHRHPPALACSGPAEAVPGVRSARTSSKTRKSRLLFGRRLARPRCDDPGDRRRVPGVVCHFLRRGVAETWCERAPAGEPGSSRSGRGLAATVPWRHTSPARAVCVERTPEGRVGRAHD